MFPVSFSVSDANDMVRSLKEVKEQLRSIPDKGIGFGILRYLSNITPELVKVKEVASLISFNYLGQLDENSKNSHRIFGRSTEFQNFVDDTSVSQKNSPYRVLDINSSIRKGKLNFSWE